MVDLDIDIWSRGRDAAQAGRFSERMMKASYPFVEVPQSTSQEKFRRILRDHFNELNHLDQAIYKVWPIYHTKPILIFFQSREDADLFRALLYVY